MSQVYYRCAQCITFFITMHNEGNKTSNDIYKCVTLSPVLSKLFEMILLIDLQKICILTHYSLALRRRLAVVKPYLPYNLLLNIIVNQAQLLHCVP